MSHVNGDDIDEIFRRASEKYPLRTDNGDWGKLAADLESDPSMILAPLTPDGDRRRKRKFLWLLLLLPLGGVGYYATQMTGHGAVRKSDLVQNSALVQPARETASPSLGSSSVKPASATPASVKPASVKPASATPASVTTASAASATPSTLTGPSSTKAANPSARNQVQHIPGSFSDASARFPQQSGHSVAKLSGQPNVNTGQGNTGHGSTGQGNTGHGSTGQGNTGQGNAIAADGPAMTSVPGSPVTDPDGLRSPSNGLKSDAHALTSDPQLANPFGLQRAPIAGGIALKVNVRSTGVTTHTDNATPTPTKLARSRQSSFYAGLLAAPDISTVKMQSVKGVGTTFSLLLGYNINSRWAIETGVSLDRKKYYTDGEYFSTKKIVVPPNVDIANVDGFCNMWEIPLNLRYNFSQGGKMKWFATGGLSTYLMTKEHYSYQFEYTTGGASWPYQKTYPTNSNYLFSIFNLSIGFEQNIGKIGNLRLEPYLRVPLAGLGTGSLPIMSAGLNIGITRRIW